MVFNNLLSIVLPIALGYILSKTEYFPRIQASTVRLFVVRISVPALVFLNMYRSNPGEVGQFLPMAISLVLFTAILWPLAFAFCQIPLFKKKPFENLILILFSNVGFIGWAVIQAIHGEEGLRRAVFFTSFWWVNLYLFSLLSYRIHQGAKKKLSIAELLPDMLPALCALILGSIFRLFELPQVFLNFLNSFSSMTVPLILFSLGMSLSFRQSFRQWRQLLPMVLLRHIPIVLAMALCIFLLPSLDAVSRRVLTVEAFMPVATAVLILGEIFKSDMEYLSAATALSTLLSFISIPLMILFWGA